MKLEWKVQVTQLPTSNWCNLTKLAILGRGRYWYFLHTNKHISWKIRKCRTTFLFVASPISILHLKTPSPCFFPESKHDSQVKHLTISVKSVPALLRLRMHNDPRGSQSKYREQMKSDSVFGLLCEQTLNIQLSSLTSIISQRISTAMRCNAMRCARWSRSLKARLGRKRWNYTFCPGQAFQQMNKSGPKIDWTNVHSNN